MGRNTWAVSEYTDDEWADLVDVPADINAIIIANTDAADPIDATIRLYNRRTATEKAILMPTVAIAALDSKTFDIPGFCLGPQDVIQVKGSAAGLHFTASGKVD